MNRMATRLLIIVFVFLLLFHAAAGADSGSSLDQTVPFGITVSKDGQFIPVFDETGSKNRIDLLMPGELCALDYSELDSAYYWHHIVYFDEEGEAHAGYVKESNFEQLTVSGFAERMADPEQAELISRYLELAETSPLFLGEKETRNTTGQHYILNTNTMKFHYPDCNSVNQMKEKNKKDYYGSREDLIKTGYSPCKNCNP